MVEPWVGCKATQIKCGQIPNGNDLLNRSSLRGHLLPNSECAYHSTQAHSSWPDLRYIFHTHSELERSKDPESPCRFLFPPRNRCQRTRYNMAKGLRSSRNKVNNSKLRSKIFGPVEDERKQRLSAKLLELASKPAGKAEEDAKMVDEQGRLPYG